MTTRNGKGPAIGVARPSKPDTSTIATPTPTMQPAPRLTLIRVQPSETAARGRGLVRLLDDLVDELTADLVPDTERPIPSVAQCEHCGEFYNCLVDLRDEKNQRVLPHTLPGNCRRCLAPLDTPEMIRTLIASARHYVEVFSRGRVS